ncbi:MAG TPA: hypothetical protein VNO79_06765 [Actinomycetota bacterium]|nr:hypothetical protein [Actinomycetota bacterium]
MRLGLVRGAVGVLVLVFGAPVARGSSVVTFEGRVDVPPSVARVAGPDAGPPTVELLVEPTWEVQRAAEAAGEPVSVVSVAQTTAAPSFSLSLDLDSLDPRFVADEGYVNVMVAARYGGQVSTWGTTVWPGDTAKRVPAFDMSKAVVPPGGGAGPLSVEAQAPPCGQIIWGDYNGPYQTKIMDVMNPSSIDGWGSYFNEGSTSTTLGYLSNGPSWTVGGTMTTSSSTGTGFRVPAQDQRIQALWMYRERAVVCVGNQNVPYNYYGKGNQPSITHVNYPYCGNVYPVDGYYRHGSTRNQTYSAGLTVYGINLSSQAGYSSTATIEFKFHVRGKVCGNNSTLGESSPKVEAHKV